MIGLLVGSILGEMLSSVQGLGFLTKTANITWEPKADLNIVSYDIKFQVKLNLVSVIGIVFAIWLYRKI